MSKIEKNRLMILLKSGPVAEGGRILEIESP